MLSCVKTLDLSAPEPVALQNVSIAMPWKTAMKGREHLVHPPIRIRMCMTKIILQRRSIVQHSTYTDATVKSV